MKRVILAMAAFALSTGAMAFDHAHAAWDTFLKAHVHYLRDGNASRVDYAAASRDRAALEAVLHGYRTVRRVEFDAWTKAQREAFLINAYNAFTIEKVLTRYPALRSIRDYGTVFTSVWKEPFFTLFGEPAYLDRIEHEMLREEGAYDDPRVHVALVCASIGCPMLRDEAYRAGRLDAQLDDALRRFLSDRTRNRYDERSGKLAVSRIFEWYGKDFGKGHKGISSLPQMFARYADVLADGPDARARIRARQAEVTFLEYDWALNDLPRTSSPPARAGPM